MAFRLKGLRPKGGKANVAEADSARLRYARKVPAGYLQYLRIRTLS